MTDSGTFDKDECVKDMTEAGFAASATPLVGQRGLSESMIFDTHRVVERLTDAGGPHRATKRQVRTGPAKKPPSRKRTSGACESRSRTARSIFSLMAGTRKRSDLVGGRPAGMPADSVLTGDGVLGRLTAIRTSRMPVFARGAPTCPEAPHDGSSGFPFCGEPDPRSPETARA